MKLARRAGSTSGARRALDELARRALVEPASSCKQGIRLTTFLCV